MWEKARGGMIWENSTETCALSYVKQMTSASSMHEAGHSKPVLWNNAEGWGGGERWQEVRDGGTHGWFMSMHGKNHHNILIILQLK